MGDQAKSVPLERARRNPISGKTYAPTSTVLLRYSISESTLARWRGDPDIDFPGPLQVTEGGSNLYAIDELDAFDARRAEQARVRRAERVAQAAERRAQHERAEAEAVEAARLAVQSTKRRRVKRGAESASS
jgi:hypothetical protein